MVKNYLKIALRNLVKQKTYSIINILGLAIGITCCLLIMLYVRQELTYDSFHANADRIFRIIMENHRPTGKDYYAQTPYPVGPAFREEYPEVEYLTRIYFSENDLIRCGEKEFFEDEFAFAEADFFRIFTFPVIRGNPGQLLSGPNAVVLTASMAEKYFGKEDPVGKVIQFNNKFEFQVTGVIKDVPVNSHFRFDFLASFEAVNKEVIGFPPDQWGAFFDLYTYVILPSERAAKELEEKARDFYINHAGKKTDLSRRVVFQRLRDIHLYSHHDGEIEANNYLSNLIIISTIGLFILLIACINFMNLTTARSARRAREVGVRKVMGALRFQLMKQFIGESILLSFLALTLSVALVELALPLFSSLVGKRIIFSYAENWIILAILIALVALVGGVSGIYPALFLSAYEPVTVLKGLKNFGSRASRPLLLRKILVILQFTLSIILIIGTLIVKDQLRYLRTANLGFDKDYSVSLPIYSDEFSEKHETIKQELMKNSNILGATACFKPPIGENEFTTSAYPNGFDESGQFSIRLNFIDYDFIEQFGLELLAGRNFSPDFPADEKTSFIINKETLKRLGYTSPEEALGKKLPTGLNRIEGTIIGVIKNYHHRSLHEHIEPMVILYWPRFFNEITVKINPHYIPETIEYLEKVWQQFFPDYPFQYSFLDEDINMLYAEEERTEKIIGTFSAIAIFVACLGLFGLAAYTAEQRTREIGVRKVLGASVANIILLLSKEFVRLVLIASIIAIPIAYYAMNHWLMEFAYRISLTPGVFISAFILTFLVSLLTVGYQSIKAALANPVDALRYE